MKYPLIRVVEWIKGNQVRAFFSSGKVVEVALPWVEDARKAHVVDQGGGLDPGNGRDVGADTVALLPGRVLRPGKPGWIGSAPPARARARRGGAA